MALFEAMLHRFSIDPTMVACGEENRDWGGAFAVYRGLTEALPYHRLFNTPISEGAIVGAGGRLRALAAAGPWPSSCTATSWAARATRSSTRLSKWQAMSAGVLKMPLVLRVSVGSKYGAQHSQDWTALVAHIPGLKVMFPATPYDAKGMLNLALRGTDPVVFFESQRLYDVGELFEPGGVPEGYYEVPEGEPAVRRDGHATSRSSPSAPRSTGRWRRRTILEEKYGVSAEVIDARFINPLNYGADPRVGEEDRASCVLASTPASAARSCTPWRRNIAQLAFDSLDAPVAVVGARNWITPAAEMEELFFPQKEWILDTIHERVLPLPDHVPSTVQTDAELERRARLGV